ncbi:Predicted arabinose efflux permease, MFS family [Yoonia litorea]|uniref:Predicted arabinose efflux permease, MFS family n=2 Tax=Yoonia litorea TaxID=1123755 RepID=A0A1I6M087_9RHOB|nr:Predicted arabinose efflux permease, MFS family [Yoonia litorea]
MLHPVFGKLFAAQVLALVGTGLLTVALGLLAFDLAGAAAGGVLATAYTIKMVAYVGLSPIAGAIVSNLPRKWVLIVADAARGVVALALPFITDIWQIYLAIFLLQTASAVFTPTFQATIPDVLEDDDDYAKALSLSRLAYDLENLLSPAIAGLLLLVMSYHWLFGGTVIGFLVSSAVIAMTAVPGRGVRKQRPFRERLTRGVRIYLATPRLRGLWSLTLTAAAASAFVIVNTVVVVRNGYSGSESDVALALAVFGGGSMVAAFALPGLLRRLSDRPVMVGGAVMMTALMGLLVIFEPGWIMFLVFWSLIGLAYAAVVTPQGRLLRRSAHHDDQQAVFTAQFALSHICWLITYPIAGATMTAWGMRPALAVLGLVAIAGLLLAFYFWPKGDPDEVTHTHDDLPDDHPHLHGQGHTHRHALIIDDEHHNWPNRR